MLLENRKIPANRLSHIAILRLMESESMDLHDLTRQVKRALAWVRLLRLVDSPACAMQQEVRSIQTALIAVGGGTFRRMATLAIASELNAGQPAELFAWRLCARDSAAGGIVARAGSHQQFLVLIVLLINRKDFYWASLSVSLLIRLLQGPFMFDDKLYIKRVMLSIGGGLAMLIVITKLLFVLIWHH